MPYVIVHEEWGIYLGQTRYRVFWSKIGSEGQPSAVVFLSEKEARSHLTEPDSEHFRFVEVPCLSPFYATISELKAAGLSDHLGDMEIDPNTKE